MMTLVNMAKRTITIEQWEHTSIRVRLVGATTKSDERGDAATVDSSLFSFAGWLEGPIVHERAVDIENSIKEQIQEEK